jgi:hypothetical protein
MLHKEKTQIMKPISNSRRRSFALAGAACLALACSETGLEEPIGTAQENVIHIPSGSTNVLITAYGFQWGSATGPVVMTTKASTTCFLSRVAGTFTSESHRVEIGTTFIQGIPYWVLSGTAGAAGERTANAFCANVPVIPGTEKSSQMGESVDLTTPTTDRTCALTAVWGNLGDVSATAEEIGTIAFNGKWLLTGFSAGGSAKCVQRAFFSPIHLGTSGAGTSVPFPNSTNNAANGPKMCGSVAAFNRNRAGNEWDWAMRTTGNTNPFNGSTSGSGLCFM